MLSNEDTEDFFVAEIESVQPPVPIYEDREFNDYVNKDPRLVADFAFDDGVKQSDCHLETLRKYLLTRRRPVSVAEIRYAQKENVPPDYLTDTIILRVMVELHNKDRGVVIPGHRTYRYVNN